MNKGYSAHRQTDSRPSYMHALLIAAITAALLIGDISVLRAAPANNQMAASNSSNLSRESDASGIADIVRPFRGMGAFSGISLRGTDSGYTLKFGTRLDEIIDSARLVLNYTYSPALNFAQSHLKVIVNDEVVDTLPLVKEQAGKPVTTEVNIDPRYLTEFNTLTLQLIAHYANGGCEDPQNSSLWANISPNSQLRLTRHTVALPDDLAMLPVPFFDRRDNDRLLLPFVFAGQPSPTMLHAAGVIASWFGAQASYRGARFPVSFDTLPNHHAVVFAVSGQRPDGLDLPQVDGPTFMIMPRPGQPLDKLLLVLGRDERDIEMAADALALGRQTLAGNRATVHAADLGPRRKPYDAPNWVATDKPVKLGNLINAPDTLQTVGIAPGALQVKLRVPADLWSWQSMGIPVDLKYRYTPPADGDSLLNIQINDQFAQSIRLKPGGNGGLLRALLPGWATPADGGQEQMKLPAYAMTSNNQLLFQFRHEPQKSSACHSMVNDVVQAAIDPDSTIDLSGFPHYAQMPNLALFANSGFPFTKYADLANTAIVLPDQPTAMDIETMLTLLGHMGAWTGYPALRYALVTPTQLRQVADHDLLLIGSGSAVGLLRQWGAIVPLRIDPARNRIAVAAGESGIGHWIDAALHPLSGAQAQSPDAAAGDSKTAALAGFASPISADRSVVAVAATSDDGLGAALDALDDQGVLSNIHGAVTLIRDRGVESFEAGQTYYVGNIPPLTRVRFFLASYPLLIVLLGMTAVIISSILGYGFLKRRAAKRLRNKEE